MPTVLALFAHPDDIEFVAAGTMLQLQRRGWKLHYMNLCTGNGGSVQMDGPTTITTRLVEAQEAASILGATFHAPICDDLECLYSTPLLRKVASVVREAQPSIVLTHSPCDYMEDHQNTQRLATTAAFAHCIPNFVCDPPRDAFFHDVTVYHAMPHGLCDPLRRSIKTGAWVNTTPVHATKRLALAAHRCQKNWLDVSQGMDSYLVSMDEVSQRVGALSGRYEHAEGWRRHLHLGFSSQPIDPLAEALGDDYCVNADYEAGL